MPWVRNKRTGETVFVEDGQQAPTAIPVGPQNPEYPYKGAQAAADLEGRVLGNSKTRAEIGNDNLRIQSDIINRGQRVTPTGKVEVDPNYQPPPTAKTATEYEIEAKKQAESRRAQTIGSIMGEVERLYNQDIKGQPLSRAFGATEYIDALPNNERFTAAGNNLLPLIRPLIAQSAREGDSDKEMTVFQSYVPTADDSDKTIESKLNMLRLLIGGMVDGTPPSQTLSQQQAGMIAPGGAAGGGATPSSTPGGSAPPSPPPFSPGDPQYQAATGGTRRVALPGLAGQVNAMVRSGAPLDQINAFVSQRGGQPIDPRQYAAVRAFLAKNPNYQGSLVDAFRTEPLSMYEKGISALGGNPIGAAIMGGGQFLSGNTLDNLAPDPERARLTLGLTEAQFPNATAAGEIGAGVVGSLLGEGALGRLGMASGLGRGLLADAATGAASGAGAADNGNRLGGAATGALAAGVGSLGGTLATRGASRVLGPTGGELAPLYNAGVRPTLGQRVASKGVLGNAINNVEQALQSVPLVGASIRGARQQARNQFQIGAFNEALGEVGEQLPRGMAPGTDPHKYAQNVFNRVYEQARGGMHLVADEEMANELSRLAPDIQTLGPAAQAQLGRIMDNSVNNRVTGGEMAGQAYKKAQSSLGKHIARLGKSPQPEDQQLAEVLRGVSGAMDSAARRHSDPDAVALLDAADRGYARLVRIEDAAARRGGDDGTFSPAQFSSATQKTSGGVRSKAFLRGDALMQDFAQAGRSLEDTMPNSGTTDRALVAGGAAGAAGYLEPTTLGILGAIGTAYAPGVRRVMQRALAPAGPSRRAIAERLRRRDRLMGRIGGATGSVAAVRQIQ